MAGWRPPDSTPLEEIREARSALAGAREFLEAEQGRPGRVDLAVLTGGNSLALQLLHDALGYRTTNVQKRSARSAIATASRVLKEVSKGRDPTVERAVFRSLAQSSKRHSSRADEAAVDEAGQQVASRNPVAGTSEDAVSDPRRPVAQPRQSEGVRVQLRETSGTQIRRLTEEGLRRAREFLAHMRDNPSADRQPPRVLLFDERYSREFKEPVRVDRRPFQTRREVAEYFVPKFESIRHLVVDDARLWSWLGMFYFADTVRVQEGEARLSPLDETFVVHREDSRSYMLRFRHYLWGAWRLFETHGESVAFLLDQDLTSFTHIAQRTFGTTRIFNSTGIIQLILRLYTRDKRQIRGFRRGPGGLDQFLRILDQLERTYDIYGMNTDTLLHALPIVFQRRHDHSATELLEKTTTTEPKPADREPQLGRRRLLTAPTSDSDDPSGETSSRVDVRGTTLAGNSPEREPVPVRRELEDVRARVERQSSVAWADPREHMEEGSQAWKAYVAVCGAPERRLFRTAFLYRLDEVLASLD